MSTGRKSANSLQLIRFFAVSAHGGVKAPKNVSLFRQQSIVTICNGHEYMRFRNEFSWFY